MIIVKCSAEKVGMYGEAFQGRRFWSESFEDLVRHIDRLETKEWYEVRVTIDEIFGFADGDWRDYCNWLSDHGYHLEYV